ncbi:hypothetical protein DRJ22_01340 [Candidatus Woesearchaeota archaeon]|nr:MAG: hypothetical protein DRJ22_01340 [Candidatus Woesearchaeota archaeon]
MSLVSLFVVRNGRVYFGRVHWRDLSKGIRHCLPLLESCLFDAGYVFVDFDKDFFLNEQNAVDFKPVLK